MLVEIALFVLLFFAYAFFALWNWKSDFIRSISNVVFCVFFIKIFDSLKNKSNPMNIIKDFVYLYEQKFISDDEYDKFKKEIRISLSKHSEYKRFIGTDKKKRLIKRPQLKLLRRVKCRKDNNKQKR